jgi:hypothetical protein
MSPLGAGGECAFPYRIDNPCHDGIDIPEMSERFSVRRHRTHLESGSLEVEVDAERTKVIVSYASCTANIPRILLDSTSPPSKRPAPSTWISTCDTVLRPMRSPLTLHDGVCVQLPLPASRFAVHAPLTIPCGSWISDIRMFESAKTCALDVHVPARLVDEGSVGSGAHAMVQRRISERLSFI